MHASGISIADRSLPAITGAFESWRTSVGLAPETEVKGGALTEEALALFVRFVVSSWTSGASGPNQLKTRYISQIRCG